MRICSRSAVDVFTSAVCWESQGGGRLTGIRLPLYDTAGATSLTLPALGCCVDQDYFSYRAGSNAGEKHHLYFNDNPTCRGLRVGKGFRYVVDRSKWYAGRYVNTDEDRKLESHRGLPESFKFSKPVIPGILY